jgi:hypothetical protein
VTRPRDLDELIPADTPGEERQRLQRAHDLLLQAGPPPELSPGLEAGPNLGLTFDRRRRAAKSKAMVLLAAAIAIALVFIGGYAVGSGKHTTTTSKVRPVRAQALKGTPLAPGAEATIQVWHSHAGNWPMTLDVVGLPKLPARQYYYVYLVRQGKAVAPCGIFRITEPDASLVLSLSAPYPLHRGDSWVVTRPGPGGAEPGQTVLRPVKA